MKPTVPAFPFVVALLLSDGAFCLSARAQAAAHSGVANARGRRLQGYQITQGYKNTTLVTVLSAEGVASTLYTAEGKPAGGAILRYGDATAFGLDYDNHIAHSLTLDRAVLNKLAENAGISRITAVPERSGGQVTRDSMRLDLNPAPLLSRTDLSDVIAGLHAKAIVIDKGGWRVRTWYSDELPQMPEAVARAWARLVVDCKESKDEDHERRHNGRDDSRDNDQDNEACRPENVVLARIVARSIALRTEIQINGNWMTAIDTREVRRVTVSSATFNPPKELRIVRVAAARAQEARSAGPGYDAGTAPPAPAPVSATLRMGPGPLLAHLDVYHFYWGRMFSLPQNAGAVRELTGAYRGFFQATLYLPAYTHDLGQYAIGSGGGLKGLYFINDDPERAAGSVGPNAFIIGAHVIQWSFQTDAPLFWWIYWGNDPLYMIYIPEELVDPGYNGYHLVTPSVLSFALSAFLWPFVHDFLPYGVAKISRNAMSVHEIETQCRRKYANTSTWWISFCQPLLGDPALASFDEGTRRLSHELVEAVTDPYPFFGWSDAGKQPAATESEAADICRNGPSPFGRYTLAASYSVATYWSNRDNACVPESRPSITLVRPANGDAITWVGPNGPQVFFSATADFPADGDPNAISWTLDGATLPQTGTDVVSPHLSLGTHSLTANAVDNQGLTASASGSFAVVAKPPSCVIISPPGGASVAASRFVLRGDGSDPQDIPLPESAFHWKVNGIDAGNMRIVTTSAPLGTVNIVLDVTNSAGLHCTASRSVAAVASTGVPSVTITAPMDGTLFPVPATNLPPTIHFSAVATDGDGSLITDPSRIKWTDNIPGGSVITVFGNTLSVDQALSGNNSSVTPHRVTCSVTGATGATVSQTITVLIGQII